MTATDTRKVVALNRVIDATRTLFHQMRAAAEEVHAKGELTGGLRGVLQELRRHGPRTVPQMARARPVSRQHIQVLVNELLEQGLVELAENPRHKRSKLVTLTPGGRRTIDGMVAREADVLSVLPVDASPEDLEQAARVLEMVRESFRGPVWEHLITRD